MSNGPLNAPYIGFTNLDILDNITHAVTTRTGPAFGQLGTDEATALAAAETAERLHMDGTAWVHQVHGNTILQALKPGIVGQADGLVSDTSGLLIAGRSADCPIVLLTGRRNDGSAVVGFAHASWRSTVKAITRLLVEKLTDEMDCQKNSLHAAIAPSAGPCCYEIGEEVREQALKELGPNSSEFFIRRNNNLFFDLWAANISQLTESGVPEEQIEISDTATICDGDNFWSWRKQGHEAGRFAAVIGISEY